MKKLRIVFNFFILSITILLLANLFSPYIRIELSDNTEGAGAYVAGIIENLLGETVHSDGAVSVSAVGLARNVHLVLEELQDEKLLVAEKLLEAFLAGPVMVAVLLIMYVFFIFFKKRWKYLLLSLGALGSGIILVLGPFVWVPESIVSYIKSLVFFDIPEKYLSVQDVGSLIRQVMGWGYWLSLILLLLLMIMSILAFFIYVPGRKNS